jgi:hypothetical protein
MAYAVKYRRGTTAEHASFTGAAGEITVNTTTNQLIVHDGVTVGGHAISAGVSGGGGPSTLTDLNISDGTDGQVLTTDGTGTFTFTTVTNSGGSSQTSTIISPSAFAYVNTTSDGSGTNISWSNWNNSNGTMDFTFETAQPDVNYAVISDVEGFDDINIQVSSKSTTGFTVSIYDGSGNVASPDITGTFSIIVYASTPTVEVNGSSNSSSVGSDEVYILADMPALIAKTGMITGDKAYLTSNNNLYLYTGTGWYLIASVQNDAPSAITNVNSSYVLSIDGTPTVITAASTDPEGFPLTWSYAVTSGSLGATTISQTDNVFTITPSTNSADSGEFTLTIGATDGTNGAVNTITSMLLQFSVVNSRNTQLLVTATGTSDNSNVTDSSTNNHTVTTTGDAVSGTFSPYRHGGYSMYFNGIFDQLNIASHESLGFGTGDFTIEFWTQWGGTFSSASGGAMVDLRSAVDASATVIYLSTAVTGGKITFYDGPANTEISTGIAITKEWTHIALARESGVWRIFINGTLRASRTSSTNLGSSQPIRIGQGINGWTTAYDGHISDLRIVKGTAIYTSNFTPPNERLESVPNTSLLTCHLPYYADGSSNNHTVILGGHIPKIEPFAPYDYAEYNPTDHGGSVYFDGSGDYLDLDFAAIGTSDYTIECWIYVTSSSSNELICDFRPTGSDNSTGIWMYFSSSNKLVVGTGGSVYITGTTTYPDNQWVHVSVQRVGGLLTLYGNGILQGTKSNVSTNLTSTDMRVGTNRSAASVYHGYISDFKLVKSALRVDANGSHLPYFDLPTEPSDSTGTEIHIKGTDASIIDKTQNKTILTLEGNTTGSTTQVKFANSKSIYVDGSGDNVTITDLEMGSADLTFELWMYQDVVQSTSYRGIICASSYADQHPFTLYTHNSTLQLWLDHSGVGISGPFTAFTWHHVAIVRNSGIWTLYIDGISVGTSTIGGTYNFTNTINFLLGQGTGGIHPAYYWKGYLQDVRFTKGVARYTTNFTPSTSPLEG